MTLMNPFKILCCPVATLLGVTALSFLALTAAFASEAFLGLEPCIMCIYQRWPYALIILLGIIGLFGRKVKSLPQVMLGLSGIAFLVNSGLAFYHTGIERKWWESAVEGCTVPNFGEAEPQSILENIMSAPTASCTEIPWQDPLIGLSMANYNVILCFGLFVICMISVFLSSKKRRAC